jgi:hypothetical protein
MSDVMYAEHAEKGNNDEAAARGLVELTAMMMKMLRLMGSRRPGVSSLSRACAERYITSP